MKFTYLFILVFFLQSSVFTDCVYAQKNKKKYTTREVKLDTTPVKSSYYQFPFKNLNKTYYYNEAELQQIHSLEEKKEIIKVLPILENYVMNFGMQNFQRNTGMLWRLGQLYELTGQDEKAKVMYTVVLKHHRGKEIKKILQHYDT